MPWVIEKEKEDDLEYCQRSGNYQKLYDMVNGQLDGKKRERKELESDVYKAIKNLIDVKKEKVDSDKDYRLFLEQIAQMLAIQDKNDNEVHNINEIEAEN